MKLVCPGCGTQGSAELFTADAHARQCVALMGRVPPSMAPAVLGYLGLFRPPSRALGWARVQTLLEDLIPAIEAGAISRGGREFPVTPAIVQAALDQVLQQREKLDLPLRGHGYLLEVLRAQSQRHAKGEQEAEKIQATPAAERNRRHVALSNLAAEKAGRERLGLPPMTSGQERDFLDSQGIDP